MFKLKNFRIQVILRMLLILGSLFLLFYLIFFTVFYITSAIVGLLVIYQIAAQIRYVENTNRKLSNFLHSIKHADFSTSFTDKRLGTTFDELDVALNQVINEFRSTRAEKEEHFNYLQTVIQHINIGIISFKKNEQVDLVNNAIKKIFRINKINKLDDFQRVNDNLPQLFKNMQAGDSMIYKIFVENELLQLLFRATMFRMRNDDYMLVSVQNIHSELEEKEIESWQKLIRVLTHEIMNSITPIASLASTVKDLLLDEEGELVSMDQIDSEAIENTQAALTTIEKRSQGLLNFVNIYRNLTRIPKPNFKYIPVSEVVMRVKNLMEPKLLDKNIQFDVTVQPEQLKFTADPDLIEQVLINLVLNAVDAVQNESQPRIRMSASISESSRTIITIEDNGHGINHDMLEKIFIPFFTSKKNGSGIGLSLSRQIMHLHKGMILVKSEPSDYTVFTLVF